MDVVGTDDEIRKILNDKDIERLRKRFLCSLKDMDNGANRYYEFGRANTVYQMRLKSLILAIMSYFLMSHTSGSHFNYLRSSPFQLVRFCAQNVRFFPRKYYFGQIFSFICSRSIFGHFSGI